jgi:hypothetical protein
MVWDTGTVRVLWVVTRLSNYSHEVYGHIYIGMYIQFHIVGVVVGNRLVPSKSRDATKAISKFWKHELSSFPRLPISITFVYFRLQKYRGNRTCARNCALSEEKCPSLLTNQKEVILPFTVTINIIMSFRGALKYHIRAYSLAVKDLTEAVAIDCRCSLAYFNRAVCYHAMSFFQKVCLLHLKRHFVYYHIRYNIMSFYILHH